jgi:ribonuclease G
LPSGGSLIIESTEAMTVIDVNTGKFIGKTSLEETIVKTNTEAAQEIVRQLRLRNIGGLIVIDFIDMSSLQNRQKVVKFFEQALKENDKFQSVVLKISEFGLVQMTRKRSGKTLIQQLMISCQQCHGCGFNKSIRTISFYILRQLHDKLTKELGEHKKVTLTVGCDIFAFITEVAYNSVLELEKKFNCNLVILRKNGFAHQSYQIDFEK